MIKRKPVRFIHWSDTHLGYFRFNKSNSEGINQRMIDFQNSFMQCVDFIISKKPDFTIHSGDIFDSPYPPNRSRKIVNEGLKKLSSHNIPTIVLSGTHDVPKTKRDMHVFRLIDHDNIYMVMGPDKIEIKIGDQAVCVYCIPYSTNFNEMEGWFLDTVAEEKDSDAYNIITLHCDVAGVSQLEHGINVLKMPNDIDKKFDYVALGHFHTYHPWQGKNNVIYAGSTDKKNFDENEEDKYIHEVVMDGKDIKIENIKIDVRPVQRFTVDLSECKDTILAEGEIKSSLKNKIKDSSIVEITIRAPFELYKTINLKAVYDWFPKAFWIETPWEEMAVPKQDGNMALNLKGNLSNEWMIFLNTKEEGKETKKWLFEKGKEKIDRIIGE